MIAETLTICRIESKLEMRMPERPFFARPIYLRDNADLTLLCLGIIATVGAGSQEFEEVALGLAAQFVTSSESQCGLAVRCASR
jgi:hypothetical protein